MMHELIDLVGKRKFETPELRGTPVGQLKADLSARQVAEALIQAAGRAEIEHSRAW